MLLSSERVASLSGLKISLSRRWAREGRHCCRRDEDLLNYTGGTGGTRGRRLTGEESTLMTMMEQAPSITCT
jgi:hypothetical protein